MADECDVSRIVTTFLLNTCRLPPRISKHRVQAASCCAMAATVRPADDEEAKQIPLITGSVAEFYIEPMLPHVGDIDVMFYLNTTLAIPQGHPPPTQLPAEFHSYVKVHEIIDSHLPGYVYLRLRYLLSQRVDDGKYEHFEYEENLYLFNRVIGDGVKNWTIHGPAVLNDNSHIQLLSVDSVPCIHCLSWPPQGADWPARHRNYGWPDSATLDHVVSNGCDVVPVAHRQCRQHEWMGERQWRLSFSRAEIVLMNSWMPVQQLTYHLLRVYVKTERLTESADDSEPATMSNYHIKTLVLWACELKPRSWWTENMNLVRICVELLHTLSVWLTDTRCPHYFINNCNLFDNSLNVGSAANKLEPLDEEYLASWFINHYIGQSSQLRLLHILRSISGNISNSMKLQKTVSEIVRWRLDTSLYDMWQAVEFAEVFITADVPRLSRTVHSCVCWMNELTKIDKRLSVYFLGVALLHVARKLLRNGFSDKLVDIITTLLRRNFSQCFSALSRCETELNTSELVELLQKSAVEHLTTYRQLVAPDFSSVVTIVTTDFEALYAYKRGDYQRCLQLSTQNVHTLFCAARVHDVLILPEFIQLLDDDIASLTALTLIVDTKCRDKRNACCISQTTLSLYLMTRCQLKLHHSVTSLAQTLDYIKVALTIHPRERTLDQLTLKLLTYVGLLP